MERGWTASRFFAEALSHVSADDVEQQLHECESLLPADALRGSVQRGCASAESFLAVRRTFAASFATLSCALYVLGIGDRHLDNWMFLCERGELCAIDFGAAFGLGLNLPVPELMVRTADSLIFLLIFSSQLNSGIPFNYIFPLMSNTTCPLPASRAA